ncbi:nucleoside-diphosphate sugar epimerase/dehydratase [Longimicrobium sp.]|uniref:polysaccharide biosynthesis protein n=1 Tax=Longimicrobium sp. TaxID=2029185 RepID=UPI002CC4C64C|nr:nucleoside-diphosphate sugar epimerase/dehydratase [Longimicrobium sp.]HSU17083.1 nucleoside-diphosphate sugar epimerase/dehydratase [Longimicrobium sp.]
MEMNRGVVGRRVASVIGHLLLIPLGYLAAFALRFDLPLPRGVWPMYWATLLYLLPIRMGLFLGFGLHRGWWRHAGISDLVALLKAVTLSSGIFLAGLYVLGQLAGFPRSILLLDWGVAMMVFGGGRLVVRTLREGALIGWGAASGTPAVIIGAGEGGERLIRQCRRTDDGGLRPVALVDDDPGKIGMSLHGVPVVGPTDDLQKVVKRSGARLVVIAIPSATRAEMQRLVQQCIATNVEFKIIPSWRELMDGRAKLGQIRNVKIEDLLGRQPVELDPAPVRSDLQDKVVLITGGAGSIGSELARQVAGFAPRRVVLVDQAESPLYFVHLEISQAHREIQLYPVVADINDEARLERVFSEHRPDYVFHAAAYKHVPLMEQNVVEAVRNNVLGTLNVAECASRHGARKFVLISTDKAVNPSSVMGATKRVAERVVLGWPGLARSRTAFRAVRFGNVLGSDGSVVPLFERQLAAGGPLTVTHPEVTRYFMTIPEAVQLVLQAAAMEETAGHIAMLDMGEPVRITDLAENLIRLSGLEPYRDIQIAFCGLRPGEKLHEELTSAVEATVPTPVDKIRVIRTDETDAGLLRMGVDRLMAALALSSADELRGAICGLVPESVPPLRSTRTPAEADGVEEGAPGDERARRQQGRSR